MLYLYCVFSSVQALESPGMVTVEGPTDSYPLSLGEIHLTQSEDFSEYNRTLSTLHT